jgi:pyridine nucleotide-disulfide oxidoreductase family protein
MQSIAHASHRHSKQLVLLGAGHAHVHLLKTWAQNSSPDTKLTLVTPYARTFYSGMVPGFIAGHYTLGQCQIDVPPLVAASGAQWRQAFATGIDAKHRRVTLSDGESLAYDVLSVDTGADTSQQSIEAQMPGALAHAIFVRPLEDLALRWNTLCEVASVAHAPLVVVGGGAAGFELACALRKRFASAAVSLVTGANGLAKNYMPSTRQRIHQALAARSITVVADDCTGLTPTQVHLKSGQPIPSLQTWLVTGSRAPRWLSASGLQCDDHGYLAVNPYQQSCSHPEVFAAGDVATRMDHPHPRSGVYAVRAGPALARNVSIALCNLSNPPGAAVPLVPHDLPRHTLNLLSCGDQSAIASYGPWSVQGRWVWRWKDWIDRRFMRRYTLEP